MIGFWFLLLWCLPAQALAVPQGDVTPIASPNQLSGHELLRIGEVHDQQEHWHETLTYYQLALSKFREKQQNQGIATTLVKIARVHERQGKLQEAHTSLKEAEHFSPKRLTGPPMRKPCWRWAAWPHNWGALANRATRSPGPPRCLPA